MATAKLWWNGSAWQTTDTTCLYKTSRVDAANPGIRGRVKLIAYDNNKVKLYASLEPHGYSGQANTLSGTFTATFNGTSVAVNDSSSRSGEERYAYSSDITFATGDVTCSTGSTGISGTYYSGGAKHPAKLTFNESVACGVTPFATITFNANGGTGGPSTQNVCKGAACALTSSTPTRSGYTFSKWNTKADGTGTSYASGANITASANTTLYAIWSTNEYPVSITADEGVTITFDGDTFSNVTTSVNKPFGSVCAYSMSANAGFIIKSRDPATDGSMTISTSNPSLSATSQRVGCHLDDGDNWVQACIYYDDGAQWHMVQAYVDNGVSWELVY